ncbi:TnsA-like heteromeric transposase endonuclease subunit [Kitasatospora sp. NPDC101801]|uniref:TnsA-like heteromeric transposase endonuclease subunit n=1 Tax=Kitasatospora sp. NPDC101801 TaxID=3364103 RepID=UPI00381B00DE
MRDIVGWHLDELGELASSRAADLAGVALEERRPPTDPVAYHGRQGIITAWPSSSRSMVVCGSLRRLRVAVELDFTADIGQFSGEPVELHWLQGRVRHRWRPDFIARTRRGSRCAVVVPPERRAGPQWQERLAALQEVAKAAGWTVRLWPVPRGTRLANLMWLADYRFPAPGERDREDAVLAAFRQPRPLDEGVAACGVPELVALDLAYRLLWQQRLRFDWTRPLLADAPVWA